MSPKRRGRGSLLDALLVAAGKALQAGGDAPGSPGPPGAVRALQAAQAARQSLRDQLGDEAVADLERSVALGLGATVTALQSLAVLGHGAQQLIRQIGGDADGDEEEPE